MWQTAKTVRVALFRGPDGNEVRYAHVGTNSDSDTGEEWACFDINVRISLMQRLTIQSDGLPIDIDDTKQSLCI
jgi:RAD51-like protein 2